MCVCVFALFVRVYPDPDPLPLPLPPDEDSDKDTGVSLPVCVFEIIENSSLWIDDRQTPTTQQKQAIQNNPTNYGQMCCSTRHESLRRVSNQRIQMNSQQPTTTTTTTWEIHIRRGTNNQHNQ